MSYTEFDFPHTHFYDSDLRELLKYVKELWDRVNKLDSWKITHEEEYKELKKLYDALMAGEFTPEMEEALYKWTTEHTTEIIGQAIKTVHFGLTNDGYFCAYIPKAWSDVHFDTITDYNDPLYGHLTLSYD